MNKTFVIISITLHALCYHSSAASMKIDILLSHKDIEPQIISKIPQQDFPDMRLVCKKWAQRGVDGIMKKDYQLMPDSVEKHYNHIIKQNKEFRSIYKMMILFDLINDFNAVVWMVDRNTNKGIELKSKYFSTPCVVTAAMLAIHYEQPETARLLIETNEKHYANQNWKDLYHKTLTIPKQIEECLSPGHNRDFSFIPYLTAAWLDNEHNLKKLYEHKIPTILGQSLIINTCLRDNAIKCFKYLASHEKTQKAIRKKVTEFFMLTIDQDNPKIAKIFIKKKLFNINGYYEEKHNEKTVLTTLLDFYLQNEKYKNNEQAHALLRKLGAKTYQEIQDEIRIRRERETRRRQKWDY